MQRQTRQKSDLTEIWANTDHPRPAPAIRTSPVLARAGKVSFHFNRDDQIMRYNRPYIEQLVLTAEPTKGDKYDVILYDTVFFTDGPADEEPRTESSQISPYPVPYEVAMDGMRRLISQYRNRGFTTDTIELNETPNEEPKP